MEWRKAVGPKVKNMFTEYVELSNEAARLNNFTNNADYWLDNYETPDFREQIQSLWEQIKPLYLQIHGYVRHQLRKKYGDVVSEKGPIPAHLLGKFLRFFCNRKSFSFSREYVVPDLVERSWIYFTPSRKEITWYYWGISQTGTNTITKKKL